MPVKDTKQYKFTLKIFSVTSIINVNIQQKVCVLAYRYTDRQTDGWMDERTGGCLNVWTGGWTNGCVDGEI